MVRGLRVSDRFWFMESMAAFKDCTRGCICWFCCSMKVLPRSRSDLKASIPHFPKYKVGGGIPTRKKKGKRNEGATAFDKKKKFVQFPKKEAKGGGILNGQEKDEAAGAGALTRLVGWTWRRVVRPRCQHESNPCPRSESGMLPHTHTQSKGEEERVSNRREGRTGVRS